jgi:acyl-CoA thioesterase I
MNKKTAALTLTLSVLLVSSAVAYYLLTLPYPEPIRVACVGDSLTQSSEYPYDLMNALGSHYNVTNFGVGATTVSLKSETPYLNTTAYREALDFQPNIVVIMLGTNDAQPSLHQFNSTFKSDYLKLINSFKAIESKPKIWIVLPPPIFSDQSGKISPQYFTQTIIPNIRETANQANLPLIDVYSALIGYPTYFPDGVHVNGDASKIMAQEIYKEIK